MKTIKNPFSIVVTKTVMRKSLSVTVASAYPMRSDPILQELWAIKAALNKEANYDAAALLRSAQNVVNGLRAV